MFAWILFPVVALLAVICVSVGAKIMLSLNKNVSSNKFKYLSVTVVMLLSINGVALAVNFIIGIMTNWDDLKLNVLIGLPWKCLYTVALSMMMIIFLLRLQNTFQGTIYAFSRKVFLTLIICFITSIVCSLASIIWEFVLFIFLDANEGSMIEQLLGFVAVLFYIITSVSTVVLFVKSIFRVCYSYNYIYILSCLRLLLFVQYHSVHSL